MDGVSLLVGAVGFLTSLGAVESFLHRRRIGKIPIRVHVNGTRGKSSVTRLIAAGLRGGGIRTVAKTTGTLPRLIRPDGSEEPIHRRSRPNVIEQLGVVRRAVQLRAEALVVECMALQPALQSLSELKLIRSTHGVITNARPDHLDVMGPTPRDVAQALAGTVPVGGKLFTAEQEHLDVLIKAAEDRGSSVRALNAYDLALVSPAELSRFRYIEHCENVALALSVCREIGVDREAALAGMLLAEPDPGAMTVEEIGASGRPVTFVNAFAANDPQSTRTIWELARRQVPDAQRRVAVINCRDDRPDRSRQLAEMCAALPAADDFYVIGTGTAVFARRASAVGIALERITMADGEPPAALIDRIAARTDGRLLVVGVGNIGGAGGGFVDHVKSRRDIREAQLFKEAA